MEVKDALKVLGVEKTVWIDDIFGINRQRVFDSLVENEDLIVDLGFDDLADAITGAEFDRERDALRTLIEEAPQGKIDQIRDALLNAIAKRGGVSEFTGVFVLKVRELLNIGADDCWDFVDAGGHIDALCASPTAKVACIVDLNNALGGDAEAGLAVLRHLSEKNFRGTVFMLSHEANLTSEAQLEKSLRKRLIEENANQNIPPVCVISKERFQDPNNEEALQESLCIALKRAGLRRSLHDVLGSLKEKMAEAFSIAQDTLYGLAPEQLDRYIVDMGYDEGLSELNVVERAVTAQMSSEIRKELGLSKMALDSASRMRTLRTIQLKPVSIEKAEESLSFFRRLEIWEDATLINEGLSPLASGDVFAYDMAEFNAKDRKLRKIQRFLLLGQPCDVQLRSTGTRRSGTAFLIPLTAQDPNNLANCDRLKKPLLPFKIHDDHYAIDFGDVAMVRLGILDLACVRKDGRVCYEKDQASVELLDGLKIQLDNSRKALEALIAEPLRGQDSKLIDDPKQMLVFGGPDALVKATQCKQKAPTEFEDSKLGERVAWGLRREGRIRAPYAAAMLRSYLAVVGREAYDVDFTAERPITQSVARIAPASAKLSGAEEHGDRLEAEA